MSLKNGNTMKYAALILAVVLTGCASIKNPDGSTRPVYVGPTIDAQFDKNGLHIGLHILGPATSGTVVIEGGDDR